MLGVRRLTGWYSIPSPQGRRGRPQNQLRMGSVPKSRAILDPRHCEYRRAHKNFSCFMRWIVETASDQMLVLRDLPGDRSFCALAHPVAGKRCGSSQLEHHLVCLLETHRFIQRASRGACME
jgi:hypothetical protein